MEALQAGLEGNPLVLIQVGDEGPTAQGVLRGNNSRCLADRCLRWLRKLLLAPALQGPPGTGKTRTILNMLSVVMHAAAKGSLELLQAGAMGSSREVRGSWWQLVASAVAGAAPGAAGAAGLLQLHLLKASRSWPAGHACSPPLAARPPSMHLQLILPELRHQLWRAQSPWYFGGASALDEVGPRPQERGAAIPAAATPMKIGAQSALHLAAAVAALHSSLM
jgi:hypothetical protein